MPGLGDNGSEGKDIDVAVVGATGYTGRLVLGYLGSLAEADRGRLAIAGRSVDRMREAVASEAGGLQPAFLVADTTDPASLSSLCARARVVLNLAGPYTESGPAVVEACVQQGAHYLDLTGEPLFMRGLIDRHHASARARGVRVMPAAGFECLPFDLVTLFAAKELFAEHGVPCERVDVSVQMQVRDRAVMKDTALSGGTTATLLTLLSAPQGKSLGDPSLLLPDGVDQEGPRQRHQRAGSAHWDPLSESWSTPVYPAPTLCPQVILRSVALACQDAQDCPFEASSFTYRDCASLQGMVTGPHQRLVAHAASMMINAGMRVAESGRSWQRELLAGVVKRVGAATGEGPSLDLLDQFDYLLTARASGAGGASVDAVWQARGNPGYLSTAKMVTQAALALAFDGHALPAHCGVVTTAAGLGVGPTMLARLRRADVELRRR